MPRITPTHYKKLVSIFEKEGFRVIRQKGDHLVLTKPGISRPIIIPMYKEMPVFIIKNNLRIADISRERYFQLLRQVL